MSSKNSPDEMKDSKTLESFVVLLNTKTQEQIPALFIHNKKCTSNMVILYSHGNSTDLGRMFRTLQKLSSKLKVHIFAYEYNGYGPTKGTVGEYGVLFGICAAYEYLTQIMGITWYNIILYGRSIGSGPTVYLASHPSYPVIGVILHAPLASGLRVINFDINKTDKEDLFPNCDYIEKVKAHVFIMHGTEDSIVPISHGNLLATKCQNLYKPWWVQKANHNDIDSGNNKKEYFCRLDKFLKYLRNFNFDKSPQELEEFYRVSPWWHQSNHIYLQKISKIEKMYRQNFVRNNVEFSKEGLLLSTSSFLMQKNKKYIILEDSKNEINKDNNEEHKGNKSFEIQKYESEGLLIPRSSSRSFNFIPKTNTSEIEFHSSNLEKDLGVEEGNNKLEKKRASSFERST